MKRVSHLILAWTLILGARSAIAQTLVVPPGQEALVRRMAADESGVLEGCRFDGATIAKDHIVMVYSCAAGSVRIALRHVAAIDQDAGLRTRSFALAPEPGSKRDDRLLAALAARVRVHESDFRWSALPGPAASAPAHVPEPRSTPDATNRRSKWGDYAGIAVWLGVGAYATMLAARLFRRPRRDRGASALAQEPADASVDRSRSWQSVAKHPFLRLYFGAVALYSLGVLAFPEALYFLTVREGPVEHAGHAVLVVAIGAWCSVGHRALDADDAPRATAWVALGVAAYLALALLEELDWGAVYGVNLGHSILRDAFGGTNLHNLQDSENLESIGGWFQLWFAAPMIAYFGGSLVPWRRFQKLWARLGPACPSVQESLLFLFGCAASAVFDGWDLLGRRLSGQPSFADGCSVLGYLQAVMYAFFILVALRVRRDLRLLENRRAA